MWPKKHICHRRVLTRIEQLKGPFLYVQSHGNDWRSPILRRKLGHWPIKYAYSWLFLWDYSFHKWSFLSTYNGLYPFLHISALSIQISMSVSDINHSTSDYHCIVRGKKKSPAPRAGAPTWPSAGFARRGWCGCRAPSCRFLGRAMGGHHGRESGQGIPEASWNPHLWKPPLGIAVVGDWTGTNHGTTEGKIVIWLGKNEKLGDFTRKNWETWWFKHSKSWKRVERTSIMMGIAGWFFWLVLAKLV